MARYTRIISYRVAREGEPTYRSKITNSQEAADWARAAIPDDGREHFFVCLLDNYLQFLGTHHVSTGSSTESSISPREIFGPALRDGAVNLIVAHNHPSGVVSPSREDLYLTQTLTVGAKLLGLKLVDHVIVSHASSSFTSLKGRLYTEETPRENNNNNCVT